MTLANLHISVLAPYARLAMIRSFPTSEHCMQIVSPQPSDSIGKVEEDIQELLYDLYEEGQ